MAGKFKVLIVEDSTLIRKTLKECFFLRFPAIEIHEAGNGEEASQKLKILVPDLIFMDVKLPDVNGLSLAERVKALYPETIIAILTSYDLPEYREAAYQHADHFLIKNSATTSGIFKLVESILVNRQML